jgi:hypothetical protein
MSGTREILDNYFSKSQVKTPQFSGVWAAKISANFFSATLVCLSTYIQERHTHLKSTTFKLSAQQCPGSIFLRLQAQQIVLRLGRTVLDGMEQRGIHAGQPGEHLGIAPVALAFVAGDGVELARVGDEDSGPKVAEVAADPRTVRARFQRHGGFWKIREELR